MRYAGIDIGSEKHVVAIVNGESAVLVKSTTITEDQDGYTKLGEALEHPDDMLIVM